MVADHSSKQSHYRETQDIYLVQVRSPQLEILYEDEYLIAINKPHGLLVHRTSMAKDATEFALQIVRNQLGSKVYPAHRLDRKTSGVLLFSKEQETNRQIHALFREGQVSKIYHAIVRGHVLEPQTIDYPLHNGKTNQSCITEISPVEHFTIPVQTDRYPTSRYTLIEIKPKTGRFHQIRKHMAHIRHPIIGDRPHGCNKQNRYWKNQHSMVTMMLHARQIDFMWHGDIIEIKARYSSEISAFLSKMKMY